MLAAYPAAGGEDPFAEDLRCWARYAAEHVAEVPPTGGGFEAIGDPDEPPPLRAVRSAVMLQVFEAIDRAGPMSVRLIVDADGRVACARLFKPERPNRLHRRALEMLRALRYEPARINDLPVAAVYDEGYRMAAGSGGLLPGILPPVLP